MAGTSQKSSTQDEDQYRMATKTVVDDAMRTDILGPNLCKVLEVHKPADDLIKKMVAEAVRSNPEVRHELADFVASDSTTKRNKWIDRVIVAVITLIAGGLVQYIISQLH